MIDHWEQLLRVFVILFSLLYFFLVICSHENYDNIL